MNNNISFVKDFSSPANKRLVKHLFTKIQNNEFPHSKNKYSVDNVFLKGVHGKSPNRQKIIQDFDKNQNLFSIPVLIGKKKSLQLSIVFHLICVSVLIFIGLNSIFGFFY